ncbi:AI-2E family transporter [Arenibacter sp. M-2]|uniref:AI-2E family transporter n=1 Tax=unclassified Arenibacter TaxID=2615047 RepID=UPI000D7705EA|nr:MULTISPECIES: AI-2E family transporter [unclassified Arenibacter]MDL5513516.1 AI-2E family transporter [Arenibacter sp. M-2]PXX27390.1 putative PurR-regulated permease PerM [Arenibacter sp. ARW7G5Y1]
MTYINPKIVRQIFSLLLIIMLGGLIFHAILPYFSGVLGAITIYVLLRRPMSKLVKKGWPPNLAAIFLLIGSFVCILLPVSGIVLMLGNKVESAIENSEKVIAAVESQLATLENKFGYDFTSQIDFNEVSKWFSQNLSGLAGGTFNMFIAVGIMYFILFYMLTNRRELRESLFEYIPINKDNLKIIGQEIRAMVRSNALGIPLVALAQGIIALIGFLLFGINSPFFWAVIVTIGSMVPFIGAMLGIIPVFILSLSSGNSFDAWGILLYGLIVVGSTDNLFRLYVLKKLDNVHPLITLIGVIVGVPIFGFIGLIFGPLLISLFLIVVRMYKKEYTKDNKDRL